MGKNSSKSYMKDALIKLGLAGMLAFQTIAPSILTVVRAEDASEGLESTTEVAAAPEELPVEEVPVLEESLPVVEESTIEELVSEEVSSTEIDSSMESSVGEESEEVIEESEEIETEPTITQHHEVIELSVAELWGSPDGLVKTSADGIVSLDIQWRENSYGERNEDYSIEIDVDNATLNLPENIAWESQGFNTQPAYIYSDGTVSAGLIADIMYMTTDGHEVRYNLEFKITDTFVVDQIEMEILPVQEIQNLMSSDGVLNITADYDSATVGFQVATGDWIIDQPSKIALDKNQNAYNYRVMAYSPSTQTVKAYWVSVYSLWNIETLEIHLTHNNRYNTGKEVYVSSQNNDGLEFSGRFESGWDSYVVEISQDTTGHNWYPETEPTFNLEGENGQYNVTFVRSEFNHLLNREIITDRVELTVNVDNRDIAYEDDLVFKETISFNDLVINSITDELYAIPMPYNDRRQDTVYIGYDENGYYTDQVGHSTEGLVVVYHQMQHQEELEFLGAYSLGDTGYIEIWNGFRHILAINVLDMPEILFNEMEFDLDFDHSETNKFRHDFGNFTLEAYYGGYRDGVYHFDFIENEGYYLSFEGESTYAWDQETINVKTFSLYNEKTGRTIAEYELTFNLENRSFLSTDDGGFGITDGEIDRVEDITITLTPQDLIEAAIDGNVLKVIDDRLEVAVYYSLYGFGVRGDQANYSAYFDLVNIWPKELRGGQLVYFGNNDYWQVRKEFYLSGEEYSNSQTIYFVETDGEVIQYNLSLAFDGIVEPQEMIIDFSAETDGNQVQSVDNLLTISVDYKNRVLNLSAAEGWTTVNNQVLIDTRYDNFNYYVHLISNTGEIKLYQLMVNNLISDDADYVVEINLSKNNQKAFGTEAYVNVTELGTTFLVGSYNHSQNKYELMMMHENDFTYYYGYLEFEANGKEATYVSFLEESNISIHGESQVGKRVKLLVTIDDETPADEELALRFTPTVSFEEIKMTSETDGYELVLEYNERRQESVYIGYDEGDLYKDWGYHSTKGKFVQLYEENGVYSLRNVLYETSPGVVELYTEHGNVVEMTIEGMPELIKERIEIPVTLDYDMENPLVVHSEKFPNLSLTAHHEHSADYWDTYYKMDVPIYEYDGIYEIEDNFDWQNFTSDQADTITQTIDIKRVGEGNRMIGQIELVYSFETPQYEERETISIELTPQNANNYFATQHSVSEDGLVFLSSRYDEHHSDEWLYQNFSVWGKITPAGKADNYLLVGQEHIGGATKYEGMDDEFSIGHHHSIMIKKKDSDIIYKYPIHITVNETPGEDNVDNHLFEFSGNASEFMQVRETNYGPVYGKQVELFISEYESLPGEIFLDKENIMALFDESTPPEERYMFTDTKMFRYILPLNKIDDFTYQGLLDSFSTVTVNILDPDQTVIEAQNLQVTGADLVDGQLHLAGGEVASLIATIKPLNATNQAITWTSTNPEVANVLNGDVYAITSGQTTITAETHNGLTVSIEVEVTNDAPVADVEVELEFDGDIDIDDENYRPAVKVKGASTAIPKGAVIRVEPIKEEAVAYKQMNELTAGRMMMYDIKLFNKQAGINVQPNAPLMVSIEIPAGYDTSKIKMYYFDEKTGVRQEMPGYVDGNYYTFEVTHFSYYVLVEEEPTAPEPVIEEKISEKTEVIPFEIIRQVNDELTVGTERLVVKGVEGVKTLIFKDIYKDGELISSTQINENITTKPIDEVIEYGTKPIELESEPIEESSEESESSDETSSDEDSSSDEETSDETSSEEDSSDESESSDETSSDEDSSSDEETIDETSSEEDSSDESESSDETNSDEDSSSDEESVDETSSEEDSSDESESSDETSSDEDSSSDEENSDETSSEDEPGKDDETPEEPIELTIEVLHEWLGVSLNGQETGLNGQFISETIKVKDGEEFTVKALTASDVKLETIEGAHEFIAPKDQTVKASADQTTITMIYQIVQKNSEEQVTALEEMLAKAKATIASIEAKEVVAKSLNDGWIRKVSAQTVTFDEAQAAVITQAQVLSAYLTTIKQGGYIPVSSINQSLVTTQTAIDTLVAVGQEKDQPAKESPVKEVTKGKTKEGQLPNTGEDSTVWVRILAFVLLAFGVVVLFKGKKRRNI